MKEFAEDNFKLGENCRKFSKSVENTVDKGEIAGYKQSLLFPQCFSKEFYRRHIKTRSCLGMGYGTFDNRFPPHI